MNPQGSKIYSTAFATAATSRINVSMSCQDLQNSVNSTMAELSVLKNAIDGQLALLNPILGLLTPPSADPSKIVTWITSFINDFLTPITIPIGTYTTQLADLASAVSDLTSAIEAKAAEFPNCNITVPPV